jgi:hypothetical protein
MQESFKLWEKFAQNYTNMIVEAVQQTVKQSETFQKQMSEAMERTMQPWWVMGLPAKEPITPDQTQLMQTLVALQAQIEALNAKVSKMEEMMRKEEREDAQNQRM